jgi:chromosome segregation ATPase
MVTRKKKSSSLVSRPSAARGFSVVVEELRSQFAVFGEALTALRDQVASGFAETERRFEQVDREIGHVSRELGQVNREVGLVKGAVLEHGRELEDVRGAVARVEEKVDRKVEREEVEGIVLHVLARPRSV